MMNPPIPPQHQPPYQNTGQPPQSQHNMGQQRQITNGRQPFMPVQQKGTQGQQQSTDAYSTYDSQLIMFTLEKQKGVEAWDDVVPEQQRVPMQDIQSELKKFRRTRGNVRRVMNELPAASCRRLINELVERQTQELWKYNQSRQYTVACVQIEWRQVGYRERKVKRVEVILETEPSGLLGPQELESRQGSTANPQVAHDPSRAMRLNGMPEGQQFPTQNSNQTSGMGPPPKNNPHHGLPGQHFEPPPAPRMSQSVPAPPPPPPPPPPGPGNHHAMPPPPPNMAAHAPPPPPMSHNPAHGSSGMAAHPPPPPPPPFGPPGSHRPQSSHSPHDHPGIVGPPGPPGSQGVPRSRQAQKTHHAPPQVRSMPGTFPETAFGHNANQRHPGAPPMQQLDPHLYKEQESRHRNSHRDNTSSESEGEWSSEYSSSGSDHQHAHNIEDDYDSTDRRRRGRSHRTETKKVRRNASHSRSRSRSRARRTVDAHKERTSRRRRDSQVSDPPPMGKYSPASSKHSSPGLPQSQVQPNIYIHMNAATTSEDQKPKRDHGDRRPNHNTSPTGYHKIVTSQPMSRDSSHSHGSDTASYTGTSSIHTSEDIVFDSPPRPVLSRRRMSLQPDINAPPALRRNYTQQPQQENFHRPHPSHIYDDPKPIRYPITSTTANDYPHTQLPRPSLPHRRMSLQPQVQSHSHSHSQPTNPFYPTHTTTSTTNPPRPTPYTHNTHTPIHQQQQQQQQQQHRYPPNHESPDNQVNLQDLADALQHIKERRRVSLRRGVETEQVGADEWEREREGGYGRFSW